MNTGVATELKVAVGMETMVVGVVTNLVADMNGNVGAAAGAKTNTGAGTKFMAVEIQVGMGAGLIVSACLAASAGSVPVGAQTNVSVGAETDVVVGLETEVMVAIRVCHGYRNTCGVWITGCAGMGTVFETPTHGYTITHTHGTVGMHGYNQIWQVCVHPASPHSHLT